MAKKSNSIERRCSFCNRPESEVPILIGAEGSAQICSDCAEQIYTLLYQNGLVSAPVLDPNEPRKQGDKSTSFAPLTYESLPKPQEIAAYLDRYVIGQTDTKKYLSVAVYNHYKRILASQEKDEKSDESSKLDDVEIAKSNIIMVGPTGCGKTLLAQSIARMLQVPFAMVDATVLTQAGYVGEDIESIISRLLQNCDYDVAATERGIVFIDEIDKIARKGDNPSITRDVSGEGVQQGLLKLLEGSVINVPPYGGRKHPEQKFIQVNTQQILFICAGAFDGIERIIGSRLNTRVVGYKEQQMDYQTIQNNLLAHITHQDLRRYGLIPEIIGRLPILTYLDALDSDSLLRILVEPKNAITKQYQKLFEMDGVRLTFDEEALKYIVHVAVETKLGARGLRSIVEKIMIDAMYEIPSLKRKTLRITEQYARSKVTPSMTASLAN